MIQPPPIRNNVSLVLDVQLSITKRKYVPLKMAAVVMIFALWFGKVQVRLKHGDTVGPWADGLGSLKIVRHAQ